MENSNKMRLCPNCKNIARPDDEYCSKCGTKIEFSPSIIYGEYARDQRKNTENQELMNFLNQNSDYYLQKFEIQKITNKNATWNWPAFLVSPIWCFYRKQYAMGMAVLLSSILLSFFGTLGEIMQFGIAVYIGMMGNYYYHDYIIKHLEIASEMPYDEREAYYKKMGGTSTLAVFAGLAIAIAMGFIVASIKY